MVAKATAVAVRKNTLPANWQEQMKEMAAKGKKQVASIGGSQRLKTGGGLLTYMDAPCPGNKLESVILAAAPENAYYEGEYDAQNTAPPVCYAFGSHDTPIDNNGSGLTPHPSSPSKQAATCGECPHNKFGSAEKGRGKACKNSVHLALIHADALKKKGGIDEAEVVTTSVPPTSLGGYKGFVKQLDALAGDMPVFGFVSEISLSPRPQGGFFMNINALKRVDPKLMGDMFAKATAAIKEVDERPPFPVKEEAAAKGAGGGRTAAKLGGKQKKGK